MEVKELQNKLKDLKGYLSGLKEVQNETEKAISKVERDIRKTCKHLEDMEYVVGTQPSYNQDDGCSLFHCKFCNICKTLFVIREFKYMEKPLKSKYQTIRLENSLFDSFFTDRITMREKDK